ncbi:MAG: GNAT family N-acetyltransferase [Candidatus Marinimicrobia bacterium]|nr:GNAT family N-acetyltransferase [Candidatus Neomarinimicrobiota bacterium]
MDIIRKAKASDAKDFVELVLISAPYFSILFGKKVKILLQYLFKSGSNLFSFEHVYFIELNGEVCGMILGYDWQTKNSENIRTGFLLFKSLGIHILCRLSVFLKLNRTVGKLNNGEYYISNIAIYPKYRGKGIGKRLLLENELWAKSTGAERIVLDVEKDNVNAMRFYKNSAYKILKEFSVSIQKNKTIIFYRITKKLKLKNDE